MAEIYRLQIFQDDGVTVAVEYSTDPLHARPYLQVPESLSGQTLDFMNGRASIGSATVEVVDVGNDVTGRLSGADGLTALIGRRAHLEILTGAVYENVKDGPIDDVQLHDSYSAFTLIIKDQRENERRTRAFTRASTSTVLPRGVAILQPGGTLKGFGLQPDGEYLVPPTPPLRATYNTNAGDVAPPTPAGKQFAQFALGAAAQKGGRPAPDHARILTNKMAPMFRADQDGNLPNIRLFWKLPTDAAYNVIEDLSIPWAFGSAVAEGAGVARDVNGSELEVRYVLALNVDFDVGVAMPPNGTPVDIIIGHKGEPSKDYPLHLEGPRGTIATGLLNGDYSDEGSPPIRYDAAAFAGMSEPILCRIFEPLDDEDGIWKWIEENIYAPWGDAPAENENGEISPVSDALPDIAETLVQLDDTNCEPLPGWSHGGGDAINMVEVKYQRLYRVPGDMDPQGVRSAGDGITAREITIQHLEAASISLLGEKTLTLAPVTLCTIGGTDGDPDTGDVADEYGAQVARARARAAMDRYLMGGQHFAARAIRAKTGAIRPGQWFTGACSWWPDYATGTRGGNRLLQAVRVERPDSLGYDLELIDAGPDNAPVGQPTLAPLSAVVNADGSVTFNVTAIAAGSEARIDYAINPTEPPQASPLWRFAERIAAVGAVSTPANPAGGVVWIRGRGEAVGRRASAWTIPFSVGIPATPRVRGVRATLDRLGVPTVTYETNAFTGGVRIYYDLHGPRTAAVFTAYQDFAATGTATLVGVTARAGETLDVFIEAWGGFAAGAVVAPQGEGVYARAVMPTDESAFGLSKFGARKKTPDTVTVGGIPGSLVSAVLVFDKLYKEPSDGEEIITPEVLPDDTPTTILDPESADVHGFVLYEAGRPLRGEQRYVFFVPVSEDDEGRVYTLRIDPKEGQAPYFDRIKQTGLLSIDFYGRVNDPESGAGGGTLSVWSSGADFEGPPSGTLDLAEIQLPFSFGPATVFGAAGTLLDNLPAPPGRTNHVALKYDTADGRTTGQVPFTLEDSLEDLVDELGALRVSSFRSALEIASNAPAVGVGNDLPPDNSVYSRWYRPIDNTVYEWDIVTSTWKPLEGTGYLVVSDLMVGKAVFGAITAEAIATGVMTAKIAEIETALLDRLEIGGLSLFGSDRGAIIHGILENAGGTAGMDLDAGIDQPFLYHPDFTLYGPGSALVAVFGGNLDAAGGTFSGDITAATAKFYGDAHVNGSLFFDSGGYKIPTTTLASIRHYDEGLAGSPKELLLSVADATMRLQGTSGIGGTKPPTLAIDNLDVGGHADIGSMHFNTRAVSISAGTSADAGFKVLQVPT